MWYLLIELNKPVCDNVSMARLDSDDLRAIKDLIEVTFDEKFDQRLDEKLGNLPTKDDFFGKMDEVMGELKSIREEQTLVRDRVADHEDRIEKIESHLSLSSD